MDYGSMTTRELERALGKYVGWNAEEYIGDLTAALALVGNIADVTLICKKPAGAPPMTYAKLWIGPGVSYGAKAATPARAICEAWLAYMDAAAEDTPA